MISIPLLLDFYPIVLLTPLGTFLCFPISSVVSILCGTGSFLSTVHRAIEQYFSIHVRWLVPTALGFCSLRLLAKPSPLLLIVPLGAITLHCRCLHILERSFYIFVHLATYHNPSSLVFLVRLSIIPLHLLSFRTFRLSLALGFGLFVFIVGCLDSCAGILAIF